LFFLNKFEINEIIKKMNKLIDGEYTPIYEVILSYLNIRDLFNLSLVNKKFKLIVNNYEIKEIQILNLFEFANSNEKINVNYFYTNRSSDYKNLIYYQFINYRTNKIMNSSSILNSSIFNFRSLKIIRILFRQNVFKKRKEDLDSDLDLNLINKLGNQLEYLELINLHQTYLTNTTKLILPKLKVFSCFNFPVKSKNNNLQIIAPQLKALAVCGLDDWKIEYPQSIEHLKIKKITEEIKLLKCLKVIEIENTYHNDFNSYLSSFPNLKKIKYLSIKYQSELGSDKQIFSRLPLNKIKLFTNDIHQTKLKDSRYFNKPKNIEIAIQNYDLIDLNSNYLKIIDYNELMNLVDYKIPIDFFQKFINIQEININGQIKNEDNLIKFIYNCKNLFKLEFHNTSLGQEFYDKLPIISSIVELEIEEDKEKELNMEFINRCFNLDVFKINREIKIDLIERFNRFEYFQLTFLIKDTEFFIRKAIPICQRRANKYYFIDKNEVLGKSIIDFNEVLNLFKEFNEMDKIKFNEMSKKKIKEMSKKKFEFTKFLKGIKLEKKEKEFCDYWEMSQSHRFDEYVLRS
jgi:hypothetical protein